MPRTAKLVSARPAPVVRKTASKVAKPALSKQRLNVTVRGDLIERARLAGLNISSVVEEFLEERLRKDDAARWQAENADAIAAYNARIERDGLWHRGLTPWY